MSTPTLLRAHNLLRRGTRQHFVYFALVETPMMSAVKIGTSHDPEQRLVGIRQGTSKTPAVILGELGSARLIGQVVGDGELEKELHRVFADAHLLGEWFNYQIIWPDLQAILADYCVCRGCQAVSHADL
jgi:hypothetical protein